MNYRHVYHAGNAADVVKHAVLVLILEHLRQKDTPFCVLDTHAGIGRYDLNSAPALKTQEAASGILRLLAAPDPPALLAPYLEAVRALNPAPGAVRWYPGSPRLARARLRPQDRLVLAELHPEDVQVLKREFAGDRQVGVHHMDGYQALKAHLPPRERRGVVLIDPPFEAPDEFARLVAGLRAGHRRWANGIFVLWYPIKERPTVWRFHEAVADTGIPRVLVAELTVHPEDTHLRLNGSGLVIVNPPWQLDQRLAELLPWLHRALGTEAGGTRVTWLVPETAGP